MGFLREATSFRASSADNLGHGKENFETTSISRAVRRGWLIEMKVCLFGGDQGLAGLVSRRNIEKTVRRKSRFANSAPKAVLSATMHVSA